MGNEHMGGIPQFTNDPGEREALFGGQNQNQCPYIQPGYNYRVQNRQTQSTSNSTVRLGNPPRQMVVDGFLSNLLRESEISYSKQETTTLESDYALIDINEVIDEDLQEMMPEQIDAPSFIENDERTCVSSGSNVYVVPDETPLLMYYDMEPESAEAASSVTETTPLTVLSQGDLLLPQGQGHLSQTVPGLYPLTHDVPILNKPRAVDYVYLRSKTYKVPSVSLQGLQKKQHLKKSPARNYSEALLSKRTNKINCEMKASLGLEDITSEVSSTSQTQNISPEGNETSGNSITSQKRGKKRCLDKQNQSDAEFKEKNNKASKKSREKSKEDQQKKAILLKELQEKKLLLKKKEDLLENKVKFYMNKLKSGYLKGEHGLE